MDLKLNIKNNNVGNKILLISLFIVVLLIISMLLRLIFFFFIPKFDENSNKLNGSGYSQPLNVIKNDNNSEYIIAYYLDDYWHIIDNTEVIKKYKHTFIVYRSNRMWKSGSGRELYVFKDNQKCVYNSLDAFTLIYDDFFVLAKKKMSTDEFEKYYQGNELSGIYNFDDHEIIIIE